MPFATPRSDSLAELEELPDGTIGWFAGILTAVETQADEARARSWRSRRSRISTATPRPCSSRRPTMRTGISSSRTQSCDCGRRWRSSDRGRKLLVQEVEPFDGSIFSKPPGKVIVETEPSVLKNGRLDKLKGIIEHYEGRDYLELRVAGNGKTQVYNAGRVDGAASGLHAELIELFGAGAVREAS